MDASPTAPPPSPGTARNLVAGIGNIFHSDDGFGVETLRRLVRTGGLPEGTRTDDTGVRGVHLAYQLLDGWDTVVLLDAVSRGDAPGTVYLIDASSPEPPGETEPVVDGHRMTPGAVLQLLGTLCSGTGCPRPQRILVVGCEPACLDEGIGLSPPVAAAVDEAAALVTRVLDEAAGSGTHSATREPARG